MKKKERNKNKLKQLLCINQKQLIEGLRNEWNESEKAKIKKERRERVKEIALDSSKIILALLLLGGVLAVAAVAPNVFTIFGRRGFGRQGRKTYFAKHDLDRRVAYLRKKKRIELEKLDNENYTIALTEKGREHALLSSFDELSIQRQEKWDGIWRIIFFDIPERHKWERECFRTRLERMGCHRLQKSVFISPFPCIREVKLLTSLFNINPYVHLVETRSPLTENTDIYEHFNLI